MPTNREYIARLIHQGYANFSELPPLTNEELEETSAKGNFLLGRVQPQNTPLYIDPIMLCRHHGAIIGQSGSGKTTLNTLLCQGICKEASVGIILFNVRPEKSDYLEGFTKVKLTQILPNLFRRLSWLTTQQNAFGLAQVIADQFLLQYSRTFLGKTYKKLYDAGKSPTAKEVLDEVTKATTKSSGIDARQLNKIKSVTALICELLGANANYREGFNIEEHQDKRLVVEMDLGDNQIHAMIINSLIWTHYTHNIAKGLRENLRTVYCIDESRYLISQERERLTSFGAPLFDSIISTARDAGISILASTQTGMPQAFSANAGLKCTFNVGDARHFQQATSAIGLNRQEQETIKRKLKTGEAVVQTYYQPKPFIIKFEMPNVEIRPIERDDPIPFYIERNDIQNAEGKRTDEKDNTTTQQTIKETGIVPGAITLLKTIVENKTVSTSKAYKKANLTASVGNKARRFLSENGLIRSETVRYYKGRGRNPCFLEQTKKGEEYIKHYHPNIKAKRLPGRGGLSHRIHAHLIDEKMKADGWIVKVESKEADLALQKPKENYWIAVEIVNKNSRNIRQRIRENKNAGAKYTLIVVTDSESRRRYKNLVLQNVKTEDIEEYLLKRGEHPKG